jgi:glycosyltransferase involved in cell wall biosynthesis
VRILQVIHQFPPFSSQGSEVYCFNLSQQLGRSEDIRVFHVSNPLQRMSRGLHRSTHADVPVYHCVDSGAYSRLAQWPNKRLRSGFDAVLREMQPDIVHFHNYISLGDDLVGRARDSGAGIVYTLHDYGLICPNALLLRSDGSLCGKQDGDFFEACCPVLIRTARDDRPVRLRARLPSLARWQMFSRQQRNPVVRRVLGMAVNAAVRHLGDPLDTDVEQKRTFFFEQTRRIFDTVDLFIAPSRFLMERYVGCGIAADSIVHVRNGMRPMVVPQRIEHTGPVRIGYIGSLHPQKGIELLLEAFRGLGEHAELHVHGSVFNSPISHSYWDRIRAQAGGSVSFHGAYENEDIGRILAGLDVIVVPSLWYENAPLTINEAFMAGVPVITADVGGMAELVRHGVNGLSFRFGDAADLRARLREVADRPALLGALRQGIAAVPDIAAHGDEIMGHYRRVVERRSAGTEQRETVR